MKKNTKLTIKKYTKRILALSLAAGVAILAAACGGEGANQTDASLTTNAQTDTATKLVVGATIVPHSIILEEVKAILAEQNIDLEIVEYTDYVTPNQALLSGDLDANFFQHQPYLDGFNEDNNADLQGIVAVHFEPLGLYKGRVDSIDALTEGAEIGVPNDATNEARALQLLQQEGLIKLRDGVGLEATANDIIENELNLDIVELDAANITNVLASLDLAVINGNYALAAGLGLEDSIAAESTESEAAEYYGNVVAIQKGDEDRAEIKALIEAITSKTISDFINAEYDGSVVPLN